MSRIVFLSIKFIVAGILFLALDTSFALPEKIVFIKRNTYDSNHYYTEFINSKWRAGGGIFVLDTKTNKATPLFKDLENGVVGRFDISFDAKKIVFSFKKSQNEGYRIYEGEIATGKIKQLTFPVENEKELQKKFGKPYYHNGTDDLYPCYLPDSGIAFISTRPQLDIKLSKEELLRLTTWIDTNCQYYPSYWGQETLSTKTSPTLDLLKPTKTQSEQQKNNCYEKIIITYIININHVICNCDNRLQSAKYKA